MSHRVSQKLQAVWPDIDTLHDLFIEWVYNVAKSANVDAEVEWLEALMVFEDEAKNGESLLYEKRWTETKSGRPELFMV